MANREFKFTAQITKEADGFVALSLWPDVVSQEDTREESIENLKEAVALWLECFGGESYSNVSVEPLVEIVDLTIPAHA